jgi:hypothetical protein
VDVKILRRGGIRVPGTPRPVPAAKAANDLIALRNDAKYLAWMATQWPGNARRQQLRQWINEGHPELLARAAIQARDRGSLPYAELAKLLEAVERRNADTISVNSLPPLAAWALTRSIDSGLMVSVCQECDEPWLSSRTVAYCYRPSPGRTMTCAQLHAHARFAEQRAEWNREYRRVYNRKSRGSVTDQAWKQWLTAANLVREDGHVLQFDDWIAHRRSLADQWGEEKLERIINESQPQTKATNPLHTALIERLRRTS